MAICREPHITVSTERRPCYVDGRKALFHTWECYSEVIGPSIMVGGHNGGTVSGMLGIVEFEDGTVATVLPGRIHFADGGGFQDTVFRPLNGDGDSDAYSASR